MTFLLYGLKNCDTCRKAMKMLSEAGHAVTLIDMRTEADLPNKVPTWLAAVESDLLINKRSTTWRNLNDADRDRPAADLLIDNPTLIKRPVIETQDAVYVGWAPAVQAAVL